MPPGGKESHFEHLCGKSPRWLYTQIPGYLDLGGGGGSGGGPRGWVFLLGVYPYRVQTRGVPLDL